MSIRGYKTELDPNNKQITQFKKHCGTARFAYNWALSRRIHEYKETKKSSNAIKQHKELNALKKTDFPWMYEVSKCAPQEALRNLDKAYANFFRKCKAKKKGKRGFPKFKNKKKGLGSFRLTGTIKVFSDRIQLPNIGKVKLKEHDYLPVTDVDILSATVQERAGKWFISVQVREADKVIPENTGDMVGVDLGVKTLATCSDTKTFPNPKALRSRLKKLRRTNRWLSRKVKGSKNRRKQRSRLAKLHYNIACIRNNTLHKITSYLAKTKSVVVIEDLCVSGMMKNRKLARSIADVGFGEFRRQLEYKCKLYGSALFIVPRFYPSSKMCSKCGCIKEALGLEERTYHCDMCGLVLDRDLNAAINLLQYYLSK